MSRARDKQKIGIVRSIEDWQKGIIKIIEEHAEQLSLTKKEVTDAINLSVRYYLTGKNRSANRFVVASGAIYIATTLNDNKRSQERICEVLRITPVSLRRAYIDICEKLEILEKMEEYQNETLSNKEGQS